MKFAKVLFFVCVIGICAAAAIERASAEAVAKYTSETKALKLEMGYKEIFQSTTQQNLAADAYKTNHNVKISDNNASVLCQMDMALLKANAFASGIPFYFAQPQNGQGVLSNMIKLSENTWFIPFNTLTSICKLNHDNDPNSTIKITCDVNNKNGANVLTVSFEGTSSTDFMKMMVINQIVMDLDQRQSARKSFISKQFQYVSSAVYMASQIQTQIASIQKSDAEILAAKKASIEKIKKQIAELTAALALLHKQKVALSSQLQSVQTRSSETTNTKSKKISYRLSLESTIKILTGEISSADSIKKLQDSIAANLKELKYWLQGSVYHRVISEAEMTGLLGMINNDSQFDGKINGYFFPQ